MVARPRTFIGSHPFVDPKLSTSTSTSTSPISQTFLLHSHLKCDVDNSLLHHSTAHPRWNSDLCRQRYPFKFFFFCYLCVDSFLPSFRTTTALLLNLYNANDDGLLCLAKWLFDYSFFVISVAAPFFSRCKRDHGARCRWP